MTDLSQMDFLNDETIQCPFPFYHAAQAAAPVYKLPRSPIEGKDVYLVTSYALVQAVLRDWETFSNKFGPYLNAREVADPEIDTIAATGYTVANTMLTQDPPEQRDYRNVVNKSFTAARINQMAGHITQICDELIDGFIDKGSCDFFADFANPLPIYVIADALGMDRANIDDIKQWSDDAVAAIGRMKGRESLVQAAHSQVAMHRHFVEIIEARKLDPKDDIISILVQGLYKGERPLDIPEMLSILQQLMVAGNETTTTALGGGLVYIMNQPGMADLLAAEPTRIPNAVEEILRLEAPTKHMWRVVAKNTELGGVNLPKDAVLLLSYDAANHDPAQFPDSEACDFARSNAGAHFAFGAGMHFCIGATLARKEMAIALERLLARISNIRLTPGHEDLRYTPSMMHRGYQSLHISFDKR
jgi:cytochrome P450